MHPYAEYVNPVLAKQLRQINMDKSFVKGSGCELIDEKGQVYLDFIASYGALPFGYNPSEIWSAINDVRDSEEPSFVQPSYLNAAGQLAEKLIQVAPEGLNRVTFANSGTEAVEAALKLARSTTKRLGILATKNSFHGKTLGSLSATGKDSYQKGFGAPVDGFNRIPYGDVKALEAELQAKPDFYAAFIVEPIQGEGGIVIPPAGFLKEALEICHRYGALLIVDEVQSGLGRTGKMFACQWEEITPDIMTIAKALGGGILAIGAMLCREEVYNDDFALKHSSTFAGNTLACRVGIRVMELLTANDGQLLKDIAAKGEYLLNRLKEIKEKYPEVIADVRGRGLMLGLELGVTKEKLPESLLGVIAEQEFLSPVVSSYLLNVERLRVAPTLNGASVVRLEPPLIISQAQCEQAMDSVDRCMAKLAIGNTAAFLGHLIDVEVDVSAEPTVAPRVYPKPTNDESEGRFAFLVHPLYLKNYAEFDESLEVFTDEQLRQLSWRWNDLIEPFPVCQTRVVSKNGATAYGEFICVSRTSDELMAMSREQAFEELSAAVELAKEHGAKIVGLGAYTSVVSRGGKDLRNLDVAITTGNSYTVAAAVEATFEAARRLDIDVSGATVAVVGATGSIGRASALLLSEKVRKLILIGNPNNEQHSRRRLMKVTAEMYQYLNNLSEQSGEIVAYVQNHPLVPAKDAPLEEYQEFAEKVAGESPVVYTLDIAGSLIQADLILTATSQVGSLIHPNMLKHGAIVCDVARPADVSLEVKEQRPDVLVIDGGIIALPGLPDLGWNFGFDKGLAYACMSETILLALEHDYKHHSLGIDINMETIGYTRELAQRHGFTLAGFRSFDRPLARETWDQVVSAREIKTIEKKVI